jgi:hypothetical protein
MHTVSKTPRTSLIALLIGAGVATVAVPRDGNAVLMLAANVNGTPFSVVDNGAGDIDPAIGVLRLLDQTIGGVFVRGSVHVSDKGTTPGTFNMLTSSSLEVRNTTGATATASVVVGDNNFLGPSFRAFTSGSGTFTGPAGSSIDLSWFDDPQNGQPAESVGDTPGDMIDAFSFTATQVADSFSHNGGPFAVNDPALFGMSMRFDYTLLAGSSLVSRGQAELKEVASAIPEPGTLGILGGGLIGLAFVLRWRMMQI